MDKEEQFLHNNKRHVPTWYLLGETALLYIGFIVLLHCIGSLL